MPQLVIVDIQLPQHENHAHLFMQFMKNYTHLFMQFMKTIPIHLDIYAIYESYTHSCTLYAIFMKTI